MLKRKSILRVLCSVIAFQFAAGFGCDSSGSTTTPASPAKPGNAIPKDAKKLPADAPAKDALLGTWIRDEPKTFFWRFTADGNFVVKTMNKKDMLGFPRVMRNKTEAFFGSWTLKEKEIVLTNISGAGQTLIDEVKIPYRKIDNSKFELDGVSFSRGEVDSLKADNGSNDDDDADEEDSD